MWIEKFIGKAAEGAGHGVTEIFFTSPCSGTVKNREHEICGPICCTTFI
jgi:hypothetical protein